MAGYAVIARIGRVDPHLTLRDLDRDLDCDPASDRGLPSDTPTIVDRPDGPSFGERFWDQVFWIRESFGQLTFYLFDSESWRR
jgi:hypothetical protein